MYNNATRCWSLQDADANVRRNVAQNDDTPAEVLSALAHDADDYVRSYVASNAADTPVEVLSALATDEDTDARASLA